ncbi:RBP11-like subunits of RNA polymerase [Mycena kentingensis (nom. inval.)]|nr:RBP11-like subunits of RNA polymerase [Mycena kentingensis (nom. inval.)]
MSIQAKLTIMKGATPDLSAATYQIHDESHTIGNALRWMLMKNPKVEFCGYRHVFFLASARAPAVTCVQCSPSLREPHSCPHTNVRSVRLVKARFLASDANADNLSSLTALIDALGNLDSLCSTIEDEYNTDLEKREYERWEEKS